MKEKIYISGCGGMLGQAFYHLFSKNYLIKCTDIDINEDWISFCDVRDLESYRKDVTSFSPNYLFHLAAYTDLEYCEKNQDNAYLTNTIGVENAVHIANELGVPILYISTAGIFDGKKDYYDDWDTPNPLGHYARSKYMGEIFVKENAFNYFICRAGWMMGGGLKKDKKFIKKIISQLIDGKKELNIVDDKFGTPTYTHDFAKTVKVLIEKKLFGLYNMVCQGKTSRLEVAKHILKCLGKENSITINKVKSEFFSKEYFAPRPDSEILINKKLELRSIQEMNDWKSSLDDYIKNEFSHVI